MGALASLIGIGGTFATSAYNNYKAEQMQHRARQENFFYNERAAENANKRWQDNYEKYFTPSSQVRMLKEAGLSPSLMLAGGAAGGGGTAPSPQGGGAQGLQNNYYPASAVEAAQIANLAAQTEKTKAETTNINADTEFTFSNILKAAAETDNIKLENSILKLEREKREIDLIVQKEVSDEVIKQAQQKTLTMFEQCEKLRNENKSIELQNQFTEETYATRVKQLTAEYKNTLSQTALNWANVNLSEAQIDSLAEHVAIAHFNSRTERLATNAQIQQFQRQVEQWAKENGFTEKQLKLQNTKNWLDFAAKIFGSICFIGGSVGGAIIKAGN